MRRLPKRAVYLELPDWESDSRLLDLARECIVLQRRGAPEASAAPDGFDAARTAVSEEALEAILGRGRDIHGIALQPEISNAIVVDARPVALASPLAAVRTARASLDDHVAAKLRALCGDPRATVHASGHFWYPPGGYMGWHTNSQRPGWRLYVTYADEGGRSFFRYRNPGSGEIVTSKDGRWSFRLFRVDRRRPLWHAVYSETHRFSFGYRLRPWSLKRALRRRLRGAEGSPRLAADAARSSAANREPEPEPPARPGREGKSARSTPPCAATRSRGSTSPHHPPGES